MNNAAIRVENLGKLYHIGKRQERYTNLTERLNNALLSPFHRLRGITQARASEETIWALKGVSFEVNHGESVGIIGPNGAGKSTLLKVLCGLTAPTEGLVAIRGRVGSMLEIGTGFNPELSGRENVFLNGVILGMKRAEIERRFDEIVDFSGVQKFLDMPVKRYSSGMRVRLAFSVLAYLEPEILLIDEVLSVGDAAFQQKSLSKMEDLIRGGRTVLFVSHSARAVSALCEGTMRLEDGRIVDRGPSDIVVKRYLEEQLAPDSVQAGHVSVPADPSKTMRLRAVTILDEQGEWAPTVDTCRPFRVRLEYDVNRPICGAHVICFIHTADGTNLFGSGDTDCAPHRLGHRVPGRYTAEFEVPAFTLGEGRYSVAVALCVPFGEIFDRHRPAVRFTVIDDRSIRRSSQGRRRPGILGFDFPWMYLSDEPVTMSAQSARVSNERRATDSYTNSED